METRQSGNRFLLVGSSGGGKTTISKMIAEYHQRILAFDVKEEWSLMPGFKAVREKAELVNLLKGADGGLKVAYPHLTSTEFDFFCKCAFNWNRQKQALIIAEELAMVTGTAKAKDGWLRMVTQIRAYGATLLAVAQRTQEIDKTIVNNVTGIFLFQQTTDNDAQAAAKLLGINIEDVPREEFKFIFWTPKKGVLIRDGRTVLNNKTGNISLRGKRPGDTRSVSLKLMKDGTFKGVNY